MKIPTMEERLFKVVASCRLNFYPGTMMPTPPDYRRVVESKPMDQQQAQVTRGEWAAAVLAPGWEFEIVPATPAAAVVLAAIGAEGGGT